MSPSRRQLLAAIGAGIALPAAGCLGGQQATDEESTTTTDMATETTTDSSMETSTDAALTIRSTDRFGEIVVDPDGRSLYMFEPDPNDGSESVCIDDCAVAWPPYTVEDVADVSGDDSVTGPVDTLERTDGSIQVTLAGWPLYYYQADSAAGDVTGQGVGNVWWLLDPDGTPIEPVVQVRDHDEYGSILTGPDGLTLYNFDRDTQGSGESTCSDGCDEAWPPLTVSDDRQILASTTVEAPVETIERPGGSRQVTVDGWPVYYFQNDESEGDVSGVGVQDVWWLLRPDGSVIRDDPSAASTTVESDGTTEESAETTEESDGGGGAYD